MRLMHRSVTQLTADSNALADVLQWMRGFTAAQPDAELPTNWRRLSEIKATIDDTLGNLNENMARRLEHADKLLAERGLGIDDRVRDTVRDVRTELMEGAETHVAF